MKEGAKISIHSHRKTPFSIEIFAGSYEKHLFSNKTITHHDNFVDEFVAGFSTVEEQILSLVDDGMLEF